MEGMVGPQSSVWGSPKDGDPWRPGEGMALTGREPEAVGMRVPPGRAACRQTS